MSTSAILRALLFGAIVAFAFAGFASSGCSSDPGFNPLAGAGGSFVDRPRTDGGVNCATPQTGCTCATDGQVVPCGKVLRTSGDYVSCSMGQRTCQNGVWGDCEGDHVADHPLPPPGGRPQDLGASQPCGALNPCDPYCNVFLDTAPGIDAGVDSGLELTDAGVSLTGNLPPAMAGCTGLAVTPNSQTITVTNLATMTTTPGSLVYTASLTPAGCFVGALDVAWGVSAFDRAVINGGNVTIVEPWASDFTANAYVGSWVASGNVHLRVLANETSQAPNGTAPSFNGAGSGVDAATILYPYASTVFPVGLSAPVLQWDNHGVAAQAVKVSLRYPTSGANLFTWSTIVAEPAVPQLAIPQYAWSAVDEIARGNDVTIALQRLVGGTLLTEKTFTVHFATQNLHGQIFYTRYPTNGGNASVMRLTPSVGAAAVDSYGGANAGCVPCHSVSANGRVVVHSNWGTNGTVASGYSVADIAPSGSLTRICGSTDAAGGDSRGFAYSAITPDGLYALQTANWWGNTSDTWSYVGGDRGNHHIALNNKVWQLSTTQSVMSTDVSGGTAWGLGNAAVMMPAFSPDGKKLVAIDGDRTLGASWRQGLHTWDFDEAGQKFSNPKSFANVAAQSLWLRWPTFEPDSRTVLFQAALDAEDQYNNSYGGGLAAGGCCGTYPIHGKLYSVDAQNATTPVYLTNLNQGLGGSDADWNYQPTVLPVAVGGYRWAAYTSTRQYGNTLNTVGHPSPPSSTSYTKQLWISALDDATSGATDRSHPGFWLPGQETISTNERAYFVLDACKPPGTTSASLCSANEDCCGGSDMPPTALCKIDQPIQTADTPWFDDALPTGAATATNSDQWYWYPPVAPPPFSGTSAHQSDFGGGGEHQHYFYGAPAGSQLPVAVGDKLFAYVYLDPANPPSEVMLQWNDGSWNHRAYWGADSIGWGTSGTVSRKYEGALPITGTWVRLELPASDVGLEGSTLQGMAFTLQGGRATWDRAGKAAGAETVWVDDATPAGATLASDGGDAWVWIGGPSPYSGSAAHRSSTASGMHQHYFYGASQTLSVQAGEKLYAYVWLDPSATPSELMLQWHDTSGSWEHRAFWGADAIGWGSSGTTSRHSMGALPNAGAWVRLEVPCELVGLAGATLDGMAFTLSDGNAAWDVTGKTSGSLQKHCTALGGNQCAGDGGDCSVDTQCCGFPKSICISGKCAVPPQLPFYGQADFVRDYQAVCGPATHVQWRFFDWMTTTPADSSIHFKARSAKTLAALATATDVQLGGASGPPVTQWTGTDVDAKLTAAGLASQDFLRVTMTLVPSSDGTQSPVLNDWRQMYDCMDSE